MSSLIDFVAEPMNSSFVRTPADQWVTDLAVAANGRIPHCATRDHDRVITAVGADGFPVLAYCVGTVKVDLIEDGAVALHYLEALLHSVAAIVDVDRLGVAGLRAWSCQYPRPKIETPRHAL